MFLPPYSPELQPAERLWPLVDEPIVNRHLATLAELDAIVAARCRRLDEPVAASLEDLVLAAHCYRPLEAELDLGSSATDTGSG